MWWEGIRKFCGTLHLQRDGGNGAVEAASPHRVELVLLWQRRRRRLWRLLVVARVPGQCHALSTATRWLLPIADGELRLADDHAPPLVPLRRDDFPRRGDCFGVALLGDNSTE